MKRNQLVQLRHSYAFLLLCFSTVLHLATHAQQLKAREFVLFGKESVQFGSNAVVANGGRVGSYSLIQTNGTANISSSLNSGGIINLANTAVVNGNITAANATAQPATGTILNVGSNATLAGRIDVNGNIVVQGGSVAGPVYKPANATYSGPQPTAGIFNNPVFPGLPALPGPYAPTTYTVVQSSVNSTATIQPGSYADMTLTGSQVVTLSGPGDYIFGSIQNTNSNSFVFDFKGQTQGLFRIFVNGNVALNKITVSATNLTVSTGTPAASDIAARILMQVGGTGNGGDAWSINTGVSGDQSSWLGTVVALNGSIRVGAGASGSKVTGALFSEKTVNLESGVSVTYAPLLDYSVIIPINSTPGGKTYNLIGSELTNLTTDLNEAKKYLTIVNNDSVLIEAIALVGHEKDARTLLWNYGIRDTIPNGIDPLFITGVYPIAKLDLLNSAEAAQVLNYVRPVFTAIGNSGLVTSAGDTSISANLARGGFNVSGDSVKIGVISDSYNTLAGDPASIDVGNGDLPGIGNPDMDTIPVQVLQDYPYGRRTDEGRAMLQIVHDLAHKAPLVFRTGFISAGDFANGIIQMRDAGCKVVVDDVTYITEPFFKDGIVSTAVNRVSGDVTYFTSAGNFGSRSYTHSYTPVASPGTFARSAHDFGNGTGTVDIYQHLKLKSGTYTIVLQWQDDFYSLGGTSTGARNDLDIYLIDASGRIGFNRNNLGGDPLEVLSFSINLADTSQVVDADLMIVKADSLSGTPNPIFKYIIFRGNAAVTEYYSNQSLQDKSTIVGHANSVNAVAVGAVLWSNTPPYGVDPTVASFSSTGGTPVSTPSGYVTRLKPELTAPNGVNTSTTVTMGPDNDGHSNADGYPNFYGTSAAAPHAAAVAALVLEARKKYYRAYLSPSALKDTLFHHALTMQPDGIVSGQNLKAGYGLVQPDLAIRSFANPTPHIDALLFGASLPPGTSSSTLRVAGAYFTDNSLIYVNNTSYSTTRINSDTLQATVDPWASTDSVRVYTAPVSDTTGDGGFSNALYFSAQKKDTVTIIADSKTKLFGEALPVLTTTILYNGDTLEVYNQNHPTAQITREQLGVDSAHLAIRYSNATVNALSNVGTYQIRASKLFLNQADSALLQRYVYDSTFGDLQINKLLVTVTPRDTIVQYGDALTNFHFNYILDSLAHVADVNAVTNIVINAHQEHMSTNTLGLLNSSGRGDLVIYNGQILSVFDMPSVIVDGKLYPVINGTGGTAVVLLNDGPHAVVNGTGGTAVILLNSDSIPVVNGTGGTAVVLLNGQIYPVLFNSAGDPYVRYDSTNYPVTNGTGGTAVVLLNDGEHQVLNGTGGTAVVLLNGQYYAVVNGTGGTAVILLNGQEIPVVNGTGGTAVVLLNGNEYPVINGTGGTAVVLLNGQYYPVVNGTGGTAVILLNGQEIPVTNGTGGTAVVLLNGQEYPVINTTGGTAVVLLNGQEVPVTNGTGGTAVVLLNGQEIPLINGTGGTAVVLLNGQEYPVVNGTGGTAVVLLNDGPHYVTNGTGGTAVVLLNGEEHPVVNSVSPSALVNVNAMATLNAISNARSVSGITNKIVDVSVNSFNGFISNSAQSALLNAGPVYSNRAILSLSSILNGTGTILNGTNSITIQNGSTAFINSTSVSSGSISRTPVVIDEADVNSTGTGATVEMAGINMITGVTVGVQYLIPATLINPNFEVRYNPGKVTITPAPLSITARDTTKPYGDTLTLIPSRFTITGGALKYNEKMLLVNLKSEGTKKASAIGPYPIVASNALGAFGTDAHNYMIRYINGTLSVQARAITVKADSLSKDYGTPDPPLTYKITSGSLLAGDSLKGALTRDPGEAIGVYTIRQGTLTLNSNYALTFVNGALTIKCATTTHKPFYAFYNTPNANPTSLWVNVHTQLNRTLKNDKDSLFFTGGTITLVNIAAERTTGIIPKGKIIAYKSVTKPSTTYDAATQTWITKVPVGYDVSDIFITGAILNSSIGFTRGQNYYSTISGSFVSNLPSFNQKWWYGMAAYQPPFAYSAFTGSNSVVSVGGSAGEPTAILKTYTLVSGGSGNGSGNYRGGLSDADGYTTCTISANYMTRVAPDNGAVISLAANQSSLEVYPNPAFSLASIVFVTQTSGTAAVTLYDITGAKLAELYHAAATAGVIYETKLNTERYAAGVYYLRLIENGNTLIKKLVISKH